MQGKAVLTEIRIDEGVKNPLGKENILSFKFNNRVLCLKLTEGESHLVIARKLFEMARAIESDNVLIALIEKSVERRSEDG